VLQLLQLLIKLIQPMLVPLCFVCAWTFLAALVWTILNTVGDGVARAQQMHRIPCSECRFFTNDYHLKCTVRPNLANTEEAINCSDYQPLDRPISW
jgi:hypothetical protein